MSLNTGILDAYELLKDELRLIQRYIHAHPEVGWAETNTTNYILDILKSNGVKARKLEGTGVIADFEVSGAKDVVALRADIDALPIMETSGVPWSSEIPGISHSCGHDFHATSVLGVGLLLARNPQLLEKLHNKSSVRLIFQPAEELNPSGSPVVIQQGGLDDVSRIYALHVEPKLDVGKVGITPGPITSAADLIEIRIKGSGGHTSRPHLTADTVHILSSVVTTIPLVFSRIFDPRNVVSVSWGSIHAGSAHNAVPKEGSLLGTVRTTSLEAWEEVEDVIRDLISNIVEPLTKSGKAKVEVNYTRGVPPVINDPDETERVENAITSILGNDALVHVERSLGGEDFSWYLLHKQPDGRKIVGAMARLGVHTPGTPGSDIHQSGLIVDEKCLDYSVPFLTRLLYE
ncbi:MAG: amidohydrolase [Candidatus Ancillula sp.]|nr:amidohydrolase [Candidatus Ancillula sp.]